MISSGLRETFRFLAQNNHVSAIVTSAGGIEEDFIKCLGDTYLGSFSTPGAELRSKGLNRIGNLIVPNQNYCLFEDWVVPILDKMLEEQEESKRTDDPEDQLHWTPSKMIHRLGKEINDERSVYYWAYKNNIPVFCPPSEADRDDNPRWWGNKASYCKCMFNEKWCRERGVYQHGAGI
jgi:deoxyhypusine synthase